MKENKNENGINQNQNGTDSNDTLGPLGEWWEQDVVLSGLDQNYTLTGGLGQDVIGGGSQDDILDGGEELFQDEFGNDVDENGLLALDRLVYYDAPSGINANLITGIVEDGYGGELKFYWTKNTVPTANTTKLTNVDKLELESFCKTLPKWDCIGKMIHTNKEIFVDRSN